MKITYAKLDHWKAMAVASKRALYERFVQAHEDINHQNTVAIKIIAEYNFWGGYHFAMLKMEEYKKSKPPRENNSGAIPSE